MSADENDGIGHSAPTPPSRAWRPSVETVLIAVVIELLIIDRECASQ